MKNLWLADYKKYPAEIFKAYDIRGIVETTRERAFHPMGRQKRVLN